MKDSLSFMFQSTDFQGGKSPTQQGVFSQKKKISKKFLSAWRFFLILWKIFQEICVGLDGFFFDKKLIFN